MLDCWLRLKVRKFWFLNAISAALYIGDNFSSGRSGKSEVFNNEILSKNGDFMIKQFEVWGFDSIWENTKHKLWYQDQ